MRQHAVIWRLRILSARENAIERSIVVIKIGQIRQQYVLIEAQNVESKETLLKRLDNLVLQISRFADSKL